MKRAVYFLSVLLFTACLQDPGALVNDPDAPAISFDDLTRASVTFTGTAHSNQADATYGFVMTELVNGEERGEALVHNAQIQEDGSFSWTADLKIGASYSALAFISNGLSRKYSGKLTISTPATSKATLSNVTLTDGLLSATLRDDGGRIIEEVGFVAGDSPDRKALLRKEKIPASSVNGNSFSLPLSSFEPGKTWYLLAYAIDEKEDVGYSPAALEVVISDTDIVHFEDEHFEEYILEHHDQNKDGKISYGEIKVIEEIDVRTDRITSVREIALMPELRRLLCSGSESGSGKLAALSTEKNGKLTYLDCGYNQLEELNLSKNPLLDTLVCAANHLSGLTVSANPMLDYLDCRNNEIPEIDLSGNTGIRHLEVGGNPLSSLDVSPCLALKVLECDDNQLEALDIQKNTKLERIECRGNEFKTLDISTNRDLNYVDGRENPLDTLFLHATQAPETLLVPEGTVLFYYISGITFVENSLTLPVGGKYALKVTLDPEDSVGKDITWTSSDKQVATVSDQGLVTGVQPGICTITAECFGKKATCEITVTIPVGKVTFDESEREVYIGENFILAAAVWPDDADDKTLRWESSDPSIATVSEEGAISPVGIGTATITATAASGVSAAFDCIVVSEAPVFPDEYFREYIYRNFDTDKDGFLSRKEVLQVRTVDFNTNPNYTTQLASVEGIEYFESLTALRCGGTSLTTLDISHNPHLGYLDCENNQLTSLDVSNNPNLQILNCEHNQITSLDVSSNPNLLDLYCGSNKLSSLDISHNSSLVGLRCAFNRLTTLDTSQNPLLQTLRCGFNQINSLDVSYNSELQHLECNSNQITTLDFSKNAELQDLKCNNNQLESLDVSHNAKLTDLDCGHNHLFSLDVSIASYLSQLRCDSNQLSVLDLSNNPNIGLLYCDLNNLSLLNVSSCKNLRDLLCSQNQLSSLDISGCAPLKSLQCSNNKLTEIVLGHHANLEVIICSINQLGSLDITGCPHLTRLVCESNQLQQLDLSQNIHLDELACGQNYLTEIDVSSNSELTRFLCGDTSISGIDLTNNLKLSELYVGWNNINSLTITHLNDLRVLYCDGNHISTLDVSKNAKLENLHCSSNPLTLLDVRGCSLLNQLWCTNSPYLTDIWLNKNQVIGDFQYDSSIATIHYE